MPHRLFGTLLIVGISLLPLQVGAAPQPDNPTQAKQDQENLVTLEGSVDSIRGYSSFMLKQQNGERIVVNSRRDLALQEGDQVTVLGRYETSLWDGKTVAAQDIRVEDAANESLIPRDELSHYGSAKVDAYADDTPIDVQNRKTSWYGSVNDLPEEGPVELSGTVINMDKGDSFLLKDQAGITIDVHVDKPMAFSIGDEVRVSGMMRDDFLGFGEEIAASEVTVISSDASTHPDRQGPGRQ